MNRRSCCFNLLLLAAAGMVGCQTAKSPERNTVCGVVKLSGQPFTDGLVTLHGSNGQQATGAILREGRYLIDDPPLGQCEVTVTPIPGFANATADPNADPHAPPKERASRIPIKYRTPGNGLTVEVKPGGTTYDIDMTP